MSVPAAPLRCAAALALAFAAPALAVPIVATMRGTNWFPGPGAPTYRLDARVSFTPGPAGPWTAATGTIDFKGQGANPSTINTSTVNGPPTSSGRGTATRSYLLSGVIDQNFRATISYDVVLASNGPFVQAQAWIANPYTWLTGAPGTSDSINYSLGAGTSFQAQAVEAGVANFNLYTRIGAGASFDAGVPATLWGTSTDGRPGALPSGAHDLFSIAIRQNSGGTGVDAVTGGTLPSLAGYSLASTRNAAQIEAAIEAASWSKVGDQWVLSGPVDLFTLSFTNNDSSNNGQIFAVGSFGSIAAAVPELPSVWMWIAGALAGAAMKRRLGLKPRAA